MTTALRTAAALAIAALCVFSAGVTPATSDAGANPRLADPKGRKAVFYGEKDGVPSVFVMAGVIKGFVELRLTGGSFKLCKGRAPQSVTKPVRRLWGKGKGSFRTKGRYAAAGVRGTWWLTAGYCTRTLVSVKQGV